MSVRVTSGSGPPVEKLVEPGGSTFEIGSGSAQLAVRVLDKAGEILDRENANDPAGGGDGTCPDASRAASPEIPPKRAPCRPRTPRCMPAASSSAPTVSAIRIRTYGTSAAAAEVTGRLIDRRGATLIPLAIAGPSNGWHHLDLPLASIAPGDFAIVFEAKSGDHRAEAIVPLRVRR